MNDDNRASTHYQVSVSTIEITMPDGSPATAEVLYGANRRKRRSGRQCGIKGWQSWATLQPVVTNTLFNAADWRDDPEAVVPRHGITTLAQTDRLSLIGC
ncbi:MAG: hypothetical protein R2867_18350 [Caldilineaceae bacterium]